MITNYDYAFAREFHRKTQFEMADELRKLIKARPHVEFEGLEAGQVVCWEHRSNGGGEVLQIIKTTPARKLADVQSWGTERVFRAAKGRYYGSFAVLNEELISFLGMTHEDVVKEAMRLGLEIPARIRVRYAEFFVELPNRFRTGRLTEFVMPQWGQSVTTKAIDAAIEDTHQRIRQLEEGRTKSLAINPPHSKDYDEFIANAIEDLDFYRWVRPLVDVIGLFYLNGEKP